MVDYVFKRLGMDYRDYVTIKSKFTVTRRIKIILKVTQTKIRETLGWKPEYTFETLMDDTFDSWMK
jgi:nucleoside-diphosphate-sugar epimerase